jgi:protein-S-isoprenylcysteine O-methyltransferase Ste14
MRKERTRIRLFFYLILLVVGDPAHDGWEAGAILLVAGSLLHAWAAGMLRKNEVLTAAGPYRFVRNPFYAGDFLRDLGMLLLCHLCVEPEHALVWVFAALYFVLMFGVVIRRRVLGKEEPELAARFGADYAAYCAGVPRFVPRITPAPARGEARFSLATLRRNRELPRLLAMLLMIGVTYYRWEALRYDFVLWRMLDDAFELTLFVAIPSLLLVSKVRVAAIAPRLASVLSAFVPPVLLAWLGLLLVVEYREWESDVIALGLGLPVFLAGWVLRAVAAAESADDADPFAPGSVHASLRHPALVGMLGILVGLAICSEIFWLLPLSLCVGCIVLAPLARTQELEWGRRLGARYECVAQHVPRWWPGLRALPVLLAALRTSLGRVPLLALRREAALLLALPAFVAAEMWLG